MVTWAQETFSFSTGVEISEPKAESEIIYTSIQEVLSHNGINPQIAPLHIPEEYILKDIKIDDTPLQETYLAIYTKNNGDILKISIQSFLEHTPEHTEVTNGSYEIYTIGSTDFYIISNNDQYRAVWLSDVYECNISGNITLSELKEMLDSIGKG